MPILGVYNSQLTGKWKNWFNLTSTSIDLYFPYLAIDSSFNICSAYYTGGIGMYIAQYSQQGRINWQRRLTSVSDSISSDSIVLDSSDNLYVGGYGTNSLYLVKYNSLGTLQWQRVFSVPSNVPYRTFLAIDSLNNVYMAAYLDTTTSDVTQLVKYNSSGTLQWQLQIDRGSSLNLFPVAIKTDSSDNVYVIFNSNSTTSWLMKYDSSGTLQWQYSVNGPIYYDTLLIDSSGNIYLNLGSSITKLNSSLSVQWITNISPLADFSIRKLLIDASNNVYVVGQYTSTGFVIQLNSSGVLQWQRQLSVASADFGILGATYDSTNNNIICGTATTFPSGATIKIIMAVLRNDGSLVGTYKVSGSNVSYSASSFTTSTPTSPTFTASSNNSATTSYTSSTSSLSSVTSSLSSNFFIM